MDSPQLGDSCYKLTTNLDTYENTIATCFAMGMQLAVIHTDAENTFLSDAFYSTASYQNSYGHYGLWIGLNDISADQSYEWVDGSSSTYLSWSQWMSPPYSTTENCVVTLYDAAYVGSYVYSYYWDVNDCEAFALGICERSRFVALQPTTAPTTTSPSCPTGWMSFQSSCYQYTGISSSFASAKS